MYLHLKFQGTHILLRYKRPETGDSFANSSQVQLKKKKSAYTLENILPGKIWPS